MSGRPAATSGGFAAGNSRWARQRGPAAATTARMRERFVAGETVTAGVRPDILLSWHRCRDDFAVDPAQERAPSSPEQEPCQRLDEKVVLAELAGWAKSIEPEVAAVGGLVAITDAQGGILAAWGDDTTLRLADGANLTARCAWSERGAGTNGMGTALTAAGPVVIRGPEHWCSGFHDWDCAGVAIRHPVTGDPLGALDISAPGVSLPDAVLAWLRTAQLRTEATVRQRTQRASRDLASVYWETVRATLGPLAAADTGGRILLANESARQYLGIARADQTPDLPATVPQLASALRLALDHAQRDEDWVGVARLAVPSRSEAVTITFRPALKDRRLVGLLLGAPTGAADGELLTPAEDAPPVTGAGRLVGLEGDRMVLVTADEVRFAEAEGDTVWLDTDRGRLRVPERGLGLLERRLLTVGFLRVHRHYLVNRHRVREVTAGPNGTIRLVVDGPAGAQPIPVARRRTAEIRRTLALP